jgi:Flp pilus assembly protein TadD
MQALFRKGKKLASKGKLSEAIDCFEKALHVEPENPHIYFALGNVAKQIGAQELAEQMFISTLKFLPTSVEAANNLGNIYYAQNRLSKAIDVYKAVLLLSPDSAETWVNLGVVLAAGGDYATAQTFYQEALRLNPASVTALANMGEVYAVENNLGKSLEYIDQAISLDKKNPQLHCNRAFSLLAQGNLAEGWGEYEYRLNKTMPKAIKFNHRLKLWNGESLAAKKILISCEQGIGDQLLFSSAIGELVKSAGHVVIEVEPRLVGLFARTFRAAEVRGFNSIKTNGKIIFQYDWDVNELDFYVPQLSIYKHLGLETSQFEDLSAKFIVDDDLAKKWKARLASEAEKLKQGQLKVGLCWRGARSNVRTINYPSIEFWTPVLSVPNISFYSLMYDECGDEIAELEANSGAKIITYDDLDYKNDIDGVAALSKQMDLVISVASAPGMISATIGVDTIIVYNIGSWTMLGTDHVPFSTNINAVVNKELTNWSKSMATVTAILRQHSKDV